MAGEPTQELATERSTPDEQQLVDVYNIAALQGPDAGASLTLRAASPGRVLVGKSPVCTLQLTDPEVSRRHISLRMDDKNALVIMDSGSTNGTFVNGVSVHEASLRGGETVRIGSTVLTVTSGTPSFVSLVQESSFGRMIGESRAMRALYPVLHQVASRDFAVLIEGEGGVGKQMCAEEIHVHSSRGANPFVVVACQSIPLAEIEERIFGSGGFVEEAAGGTLYVDEVGALPEALQRRLHPLLSPRPDQVRLLVGTHLDLDLEVTEGRFREDLLVALAPRRIELPPLRERGGDVALLARAFWSSLAAEAEDEETGPDLPADFMPRFQRYRWPGNVPELSRAVCTRFCMGELGRWRSESVRKAGEDAFVAVLDCELPLAQAREVVVEEFERRYVAYMLSRHGSTRDAAKASGIAQRYFQVLRARFRQ